MRSSRVGRGRVWGSKNLSERDLRRSLRAPQEPAGWVCIEEMQDCHLKGFPTFQVERYLRAGTDGVFLTL